MPTQSAFFNPKANNYRSSISRKQAWKATTLCDVVVLQGNCGTHTLRKTWGYHARQQGVDLALILLELNHRAWPTPNAIWVLPRGA